MPTTLKITPEHTIALPHHSTDGFNFYRINRNLSVVRVRIIEPYQHGISINKKPSGDQQANFFREAVEATPCLPEEVMLAAAQALESMDRDIKELADMPVEHILG
jgi:hypothetical protein